MRKASIMMGTLLLCLLRPASAETPQRAATAPSEAALRERIVWYIREMYLVPDSVKLTLGDFHGSLNPTYRECVVTADDGKQPRTQNISVSRDGRYLAMSGLYVLGPDTSNEVTRLAREVLRPAANLQLSLGALRNSDLPGFFQTTLTLDDGKQKQTLEFFVTQDRRYLVAGNVFLMMTPGEVLRAISTRNQPYAGPARAPVTLVEYADLECPTCARLHEFLEKQLLPKYGDKVRVIFKEFPLPFHPWSRTAALANQCAYQIKPDAFLNYRSLIFEHQSNINATNVRDLLLTYGEQVGIDRVKLGACLDSSASLPRVEENLHEGQKLQVMRTPTSFINGKLVVGPHTPEDFYKIVDGALRGAR